MPAQQTRRFHSHLLSPNSKQNQDHQHVNSITTHLHSSHRKFSTFSSSLRRRSPSILLIFILSIIIFFIYGLLLNLTCSSSSCNSLGTNPTLSVKSSSFYDPRNDPPLELNQNILHILEQWSNPNFASSRIQIYVYDLPSEYNQQLLEESISSPGPIRDPRCDTNFYSSEVHVHKYLEKSLVRTKDPSKADFFYLPVYTTCDLITHQPNDVQRVGNNFQHALDYVIQTYPFWNRTNGRDHVYLFAQGFAARLAGDWKRINNGIFMVHNGEFSADEYTPHKDFTIPPELRAYLKPIWLESNHVIDQPRKYLAQFGGQVLNSNISDHRGSNYSGGVRQFIRARFLNHPNYRITGVRSSTYLTDMKESNFCLAPEGWHPWSPRPYYAILMGCIPVIISEVQELAFEDMIHWDDFAIWIRPTEIHHLDKILRSFPESELKRRRKYMERAWRLFWYGKQGLANEAILRTLYTRKYSHSPRRHFSSLDITREADNN